MEVSRQRPLMPAESTFYQAINAYWIHFLSCPRVLILILLIEYFTILNCTVKTSKSHYFSCKGDENTFKVQTGNNKNDESIAVFSVKRKFAW